MLEVGVVGTRPKLVAEVCPKGRCVFGLGLYVENPIFREPDVGKLVRILHIWLLADDLEALVEADVVLT